MLVSISILVLYSVRDTVINSLVHKTKDIFMPAGTWSQKHQEYADLHTVLL
jgi:hypothetical protein